MKWIIDDMMADPYYGGQFYEALKNLNRDVTIVDYIPFEIEKTKKLNLEGQYIAYGSLQFVEKITRLHSNVASFGPSKSYEFNNYASYLSPELFVSCDYCFITMSFLKNKTQKEWLVNNYGECVFVRPNTGQKLFSGQVVNLNDEKSISNLYKSGGANDNTLIAVSRAVNIEKEWRFFVSQEKGVLAGSTYSADPNSKEKEIAEYPYEAKEFAEQVMVDFGDKAIDKLLVIDVALTEWGYRLVEINASSTSGMYGCNCSPIILEMEDIIEKENNME